MNREIKFRAWVNNGMAYEGFHISAPGIVWEWVSFPSNSKSIDCPVMQFTGLKDKNGVDIYEGDIVDNGTGNYKGEIIFKNGCFVHRNSPLGYFVEDGVVEDNRNDMDDNITLQEGDVEKWAIVIGNIYQNPELLK